jgi:hypothetical protein
MDFEGLRNFFSHWGWNGDLLELSNPSKYRFFSLGMGIGGLLEMLLRY